MNKMNAKVTAFAPATVANVVCGFDVFGFAVNKPGDVVTMRWSESPGVTITRITGDGAKLPLQAEKNTAGVAVIQYLNFVGITRGVQLELTKNLPLGSGMGSSASSAVASLMAINDLAGGLLQKHALLPFAMEAERVACGSAHADNIAPALLGGFVLIRSYNPLDVINIPYPTQLHCALVHPHIELKTKDARQLLRQSVPLVNAIAQWGNTAGLVAGLMQADFDLIGRAMVDMVAEPARSLLIPGYQNVKDAAKRAGAIGCGISGSGPTMFSLCEGEGVANSVGAAMSAAFNSIGLSSDIFISSLNNEGATILKTAK